MKLNEMPTIPVTSNRTAKTTEGYAYLIGTPTTERKLSGIVITVITALVFSVKGKFLGTAKVNADYVVKKVANYLSYYRRVTPETIELATDLTELSDTFNSILIDGHIAFPGTYSVYKSASYFNFAGKNEQGEWVQPIVLDDSVYAVIVKAIRKAEAKVAAAAEAEAEAKEVAESK